MVSPSQKKKINQVLCVFETSSLTPKYGAMVVMSDGPDKRPQITYGAHQTTEYGNLKTLLTMYCAHYSKYARELRPYLPLIGKNPLCKNEAFKHLLKLAAEDPEMHAAQDEFFEKIYWAPAFQFFISQGFSEALSMLVIYDSYIQSGGILDFLRNRFGEKTPINKGNERRWITAYTNVRDKWLEGHSNPILPGTDYRTDTLLDAIAAGNWDLSKPLVCKFNSANSKKWITIP